MPPQDTLLRFRCSRELRAKLEKLAKEHDTTVSVLIREAVEHRWPSEAKKAAVVRSDDFD